MDEPGRKEMADHAEAVRARRRAKTREHVADLIARVRRLTETVALMGEALRAAKKNADDFTLRIEALEWTSCKFARTVGAACPSLGSRCEICEREAEAEWYKAKVLGPPTAADLLELKCSIEHEAECRCSEVSSEHESQAEKAEG